jgi:8-amino-7-oxononanoate synthase
MALMVAIGSIASLLAVGSKPSEEEKIAIFSDARNHVSIIDGLYLAERQRSVEVFVYRHSDMSHLNALLYVCTICPNFSVLVNVKHTLPRTHYCNSFFVSTD